MTSSTIPGNSRNDFEDLGHWDLGSQLSMHVLSPQCLAFILPLLVRATTSLLQGKQRHFCSARYWVHWANRWNALYGDRTA
eukprot:s1671_g5.t1